MKLQKAPINHTCLATSFAMVLGVDAEDLISRCLNPHIVLWPQLEVPQCYRGSHIQEMIDYAWAMGYGVTEIQAMPMFGALGCTETFPMTNNKALMERIKEYLVNNMGVITSPTHAVAFYGDAVYDPKGMMYPIEEYTDTIQSLYLVEKRGGLD